jgi:hypothetical protein
VTRVWVEDLLVVITVLKLEKSESNSQQAERILAKETGCNHCFKARKI